MDPSEAKDAAVTTGETFRLRVRTRPSEETEMFVHLRSGNERWN